MDENTLRRNLALSSRAEAVREQKPAAVPVQFNREAIFNRFGESMKEIKSQYSIADTLLQSGDQQGCEMIWRSQVVLAEGLLDFYIHEMSKYCMFRIFCGQWKKSEKYLNFRVTMKELEKAVATNNNDWFFEYLNERFARSVFLAADDMQNQLNLIGIKFEDVVCRAFSLRLQDDSCKKGKAIIGALYERRNKIAHQFDREHTNAKRNDITKEYVEGYIGKIESIVNAINEIAKEHTQLMPKRQKNG